MLWREKWQLCLEFSHQADALSQSPCVLTVDPQANPGNVAAAPGGCSFCRKQNAPAASKNYISQKSR